MDLLPPRWCIAVASACAGLMGCDAPVNPPHPAPPRPTATAATTATTTTAAPAGFFTATVPTPAAAVAPTTALGPSSSHDPAPDCLAHLAPARFDSVACVAGMHTGQTADGQPCRLMIDLSNRRMTFQSGSTTVTLEHARLALSAQGEPIYNLEALRNAAGANGLRLLRVQPGWVRPAQTLTESITLMQDARRRALSWTYAQDGVEPGVRIACEGST